MPVWQLKVLKTSMRAKNLRGQYLKTKLECGPMPNVMVALPNTGGARPLFDAAVWLTLTT